MKNNLSEIILLKDIHLVQDDIKIIINPLDKDHCKVLSAIIQLRLERLFDTVKVENNSETLQFTLPTGCDTFLQDIDKAKKIIHKLKRDIKLKMDEGYRKPAITVLENMLEEEKEKKNLPKIIEHAMLADQVPETSVSNSRLTRNGKVLNEHTLQRIIVQFLTDITANNSAYIPPLTKADMQDAAAAVVENLFIEYPKQFPKRLSPPDYFRDAVNKALEPYYTKEETRDHVATQLSFHLYTTEELGGPSFKER